MSDGQGYYAYLPAVFIYQDLSLQFVWDINETYYPGEKAARYVNNTPHGPINKYFVGTAVLQMPFFLLSHAMAKVTGATPDGYSSLYQMGIGSAGIFYVCLGLWFLYGFLTQQRHSELTAALTCVFALFGTNLFFYAVYEPSMSHVYSFCTVSAFFFFSTKAVRTDRTRPMIGSVVVLGLTALIRPINAIILLSLPLVADNWKQFRDSLMSLFEDKKRLVLLIAAGIAIIAIQPIIYYYQTGRPFIWPYGEEGFNFLQPEIMNVLFSYRRGLFLYSPLLLLGVIGLLVGIKERPFKYAWAILFLGLIIYIISSWWMWYYGGSFGHRAFVEFIPVFCIGLAFLIQNGAGRINRSFIVLAALFFTVLQLVQTYQYQKQILPYDEITKTKYWNLFMRTGSDLQYYYTPAIGDGTYTATDSTMLFHDMEEPLGWGNEHLLTDEDSYGEKQSVRISGADQYGITLRYSAATCMHKINTIRVRAQVRSNSQTTDLAFICAVEDSLGNSKYWGSRLLRPQFPWFKRWGYASALFTLPFPCDITDKIVVFPMKSDDATVFIDDMEVSLIFVE